MGGIFFIVFVIWLFLNFWKLPYTDEAGPAADPLAFVIALMRVGLVVVLIGLGTYVKWNTN